LGVLLDKPAVGCAKSRLVGEHAEPRNQRGAFTHLRYQGERLGTVLRTRTGVKPLFVSPGHRCDHPGAIELVLRCGVRFRLPEPVRLADRGVAAFKRKRLAR
ncbi:MAG: endonuclease V, partial [Gammaproteobacteria bacterium]|nr:endonuclease V [Gammaproteobacteria bacterium]